MRSSKKQLSVVITIPISVAIAAVWWLILVYRHKLGWIGIIAILTALCAVYWFAIMKWQRGEVLPFMRYTRMLVSTVVQMIFLSVAHGIYFRSHSIDQYAPYTAVVRCWFLIAPFAQYILTELTFRQLHRLRVRIKRFRLQMAMIKNQINKERKK